MDKLNRLLSLSLRHLLESLEDVIKQISIRKATAGKKPLDETFAIRSLNKAIDNFRNDLEEILTEYYKLKDSGKEQHVAPYLDDQLQRIREKARYVRKNLTDEEQGLLKGNWRFFNVLPNLTRKHLEYYLEMSYAVHLEKKPKKK